MNRWIALVFALAAASCGYRVVRVVPARTAAELFLPPRVVLVEQCELRPGGPPPLEAVGSGDRGEGAPCADSRECSPGLGCHGVGRAGHCRPFCGGTARAACAPGGRCVGGGDGVGLCVPTENPPSG